MIYENKYLKCLKSENFNFVFDKNNGKTMIWGKTPQEDARYSPFGPMIADIEVSEVCSNGCLFCYKSNTKTGKNMTLDTFKILFHKFPKTLTQIAFGIGDIDGNPDLFSIMQYCRQNGVVPNITINGNRMTPRYYDLLSQLCGAVAVSLYDEDTCFNAVQELTRRGMKQVNIHALWSRETMDRCFSVIENAKKDPRLSKLNAIVFLRLKNKGRGEGFTQASQADFKRLVDSAISAGINFGFDSCSAPAFLKAVKDRKEFETYKTYAESCESFGLFSSYFNVSGQYFPCSFAEGEDGWETGLDVVNCNDFITDIWNNPKLAEARNKSIATKDENGCRKCLIYNLEDKDED